MGRRARWVVLGMMLVVVATASGIGGFALGRHRGASETPSLTAAQIAAVSVCSSAKYNLLSLIQKTYGAVSSVLSPVGGPHTPSAARDKANGVVFDRARLEVTDVPRSMRATKVVLLVALEDVRVGLQDTATAHAPNGKGRESVALSELEEGERLLTEASTEIYDISCVAT